MINLSRIRLMVLEDLVFRILVRLTVIGVRAFCDFIGCNSVLSIIYFLAIYIYIYKVYRFVEW